MKPGPLAFLALALGCLPVPAAAELLVVRARLLGRPGLVAVLIKENRISEIGPEESLRLKASSQVLDAQGGLLLPGFHDSHTHLLDGGIARNRLDLRGQEDLPGLLEALRRYGKAHPGSPALDGAAGGLPSQGTWIEGWGWKGSNLPSRRDLDRVLPDRPVALRSADGLSLCVNTKALELAGIGPRTPDPPAGRILREEDGRIPRGILKGSAARLVARVLPEAGRDLQLRALEEALAAFLSVGHTSLVSFCQDQEEVELLEELLSQGRLTLRVSVYLPLGRDFPLYERLRKRLQGPWLRFGGLKGFVDGDIHSRTAFLLEPDQAGSRGKPRLKPEELKALVSEAHEHGFPVALHASGDAAVRLALDCFEEASRRFPRAPAPRHRIEHAPLIHPQDLPRFARLGVTASVQPLSMPRGPRPEQAGWSGALDSRRARRSFVLRDLLAAGAVLAFGSDWNGGALNPLAGLAAAVARRDQGGKPRGGWNPEQAITLAQAARAYAYGSAFAVGREAELGQILPGRLADMVILEPGVSERPESLWKGRVRYVISDGVLRHLAP